jgi:16S rRNA processing protein RimM
MAYKAQILLGTITKVHGYEGAVTVRLEKPFIENIPELESVFIEIEGKPVPFFVTFLDYPGADIIRLQFDGYRSIDKVKKFAGCRVFLTSGNPGSDSGQDIRSLTGFKIYTCDSKKIGTVTGLIENPGQALLIIDAGKGMEILIPLHENLIVKIDRKKKIIEMDLPEGLTDLNPRARIPRGLPRG